MPFGNKKCYSLLTEQIVLSWEDETWALQRGKSVSQCSRLETNCVSRQINMRNTSFREYYVFKNAIQTWLFIGKQLCFVPTMNNLSKNRYLIVLQYQIYIQDQANNKYMIRIPSREKQGPIKNSCFTRLKYNMFKICTWIGAFYFITSA